MQQLQKDFLLQGGKYRIEKVLGQGGFGITYLATQELLDRKVCIKEFFFKDSCSRKVGGEIILGTVGNRDLVERFLNKFIKEARTISQFDHPNIIRILDIFKENATAYYVMDYIEGSSLEDIVNSQGALSEEEAINYIKQIADALDYVHRQRINHLDVKPSNIMVRKDGRAILIDFGVSKQYDEQGEQTSTTPVGISYGYAPIEQYRPGGVSEFSPQADVYSLGATLYKLLTSQVPPQAMEILNDGLPNIIDKLSPQIKNAIEQSMQVRKQDRPDSINRFISYFKNEKKIQVKDNTTTYPYSESAKLAQIYFEKAESIDMEEDCEQEDSFPFYLKAAELGHVESQREVADSYRWGTQKDYKKAFEWYKKAAESEDVEALNDLAECYNKGIGTTIDKINAFKLYNKALTLFLKKAEEGSVHAMKRVLEYYKKGFGCAKSPQKVFVWTQRLADMLGLELNTLYLAKLAYYYEVGYGTEIDSDKSSELYAKVIETSDAAKLYDIGEDFAYADDKKEKEQVHKWFLLAASKGDAEVIKDIAVNYEDGALIEEDIQTAIKFYEKAAKLGHVEAMVFLGYIYYTREECRNYVKAIQWFKKALEHENTDDLQKVDWTDKKTILENMAFIYRYGGYGVIKNQSEASKLELCVKELSKQIS
ncbi:MAG: serine/threonine-protein kinase [Prevotellamassilia sp.]|nr:serine/threonine-protein kinase [Prevotellamassilia sp.]